jgi:cation:H+ antiporter
MTILLFILGLAALIIGAEILVRGASNIASGLGISPLIIGLTVVAFGTSSPELAVSIKSAIAGQADIALGNVLGSNIFNILFILGVSSIITPLFVSKQLIRFDVPIMIFLSVGVLLISLDQLIGGFDGWILVAGLLAYIGILAYFSMRKKEQSKIEESSSESEKVGWLRNITFVAVGLLLLIFGSRWLVNSSITFAEQLGISELIIGLTIVAAGTSMPEVVTSIIAAIRGERDIAVGNVVGSNIFNILGVLGISSLFASTGLPVSEAAIGLEIPFLIAVSVACLPTFFTGGTINRWEGCLFLGYYIAYTAYLILNATQHELLSAFNTVMFYFVVPITVVTIAVVFFQEVRNSSKKRIE